MKQIVFLALGTVSLFVVGCDKIPGSKLVVIPKSGHMTFVDQPSLFLSTVDEFLHPEK
jgi:pimeloyl-ACP methyl ester carboxylesterase